MAFRIEPLGKHHDRAAFASGAPLLDDWFRERATQDDKRNVARIFVAVHDKDIAGFYSLSAFTLSFTDIPEDLARKLPRYDAIPAGLIGRLARAERVRGQGIGALLLADAIKRVLGAGRTLAVFVIVVDATDNRAVTFYKRYGFRSFPSRPRRLFLLASTAAAGLTKL
ncbi:MAG: GNAT family N-acetyltransferase [Alphaproteobacteria bacterium]|nr:GNAT family N-acetyltransferase [Alphaproteobacteria bacterium]